MDELIRNLQRAVAEGDMRAAIQLAKELIRVGGAAAAIPILEQAAAQYPEAAKALLTEAQAAVEAAKDAALTERWGEWVRNPVVEFAKRAARGVARGVAWAARGVAKAVFRAVGALARGAALLLRLPLPVLLAAAVLSLVLGLGLYLLLRSKPAAGPYCDCSHVSAGLLTREYREQCREREAQLVALSAKCGNDDACIREALGLKTGQDGRLVSGKFCDSVACGAAAWPLEGSGPVPPPRPVEDTPCVKTAGLTRECR